MGGKSSTSTSTVQVPQEVLQRYNSVNAQAQQAASAPFQQYSTNPNAFVAPLDPTQLAGIANTNSAAGQAQPFYQSATNTLEGAQAATGPYYAGATGALLNGQQTGAGLAAGSLSALGDAYGAAAPLQGSAASGLTGAYTSAQPFNYAATGLAAAGAGPVNAQQIGGQQIGQYLSPYLNTVLQGTAGVLNQQNQQQQSGALGTAIQSGAFGGDRAGIAAANLEQQQNLANSQIYGNILNQGYNNALSTAQQQQGVNLGAAQANRAALQTAAGQLGGLGQQVYGQGTGTAQAQAALGQQEFGQGLSSAQQLQSLGQQQFGQGATTSSGLAGLGQDIYGTGANTASSLAGLGTGAQTASLQGAAAQQAAGQTEQQTQQAGLTALYNQFLQQQSYPFQVAQFLANIAEGTGALSGSTTTTTTPGGLFSDERLKTDIRKVGKTFDKQDIYTYRYKDDPPNVRRMGLMAHEVEDHHPEAVGLASGFKTVDYGKATDEAAHRGHFAYGGPANDNLLPTDLAALLEAHEQMYAPYASSGLYGGQGGLPRGGSSYVPQANLPIGHLMTAQPVTNRQPSALDRINQWTQAGKNLQGAYNSATGLASSIQKKLAPSQISNAASSNVVDMLANDPEAPDVPPMARGGLASGGIPYQVAGGLDIPDDQPNIQQIKSGQTGGSGGSQSPLVQLGGLASGIGGIASGVNAIGGLASTAGEAAGNFIASMLPAALLFAKGGAVPDDADQVLQGLLRSLNAEPNEPEDDDEDQTGANEQSQAAVPIVAPSQTPTKPTSPMIALPNDLASIMPLIAKAEGTGKNPNSSAKGMYQIIDPTFVGAFRQMFPDRAADMTNGQILALRATPRGDQLSSEMGPWLARQNAQVLHQNGVSPTATNVYLAHLLGPQSAVRLVGSDPTTPLSELLKPREIAANKSIMSGKTAGDLISWAGRRMQQSSPMASGGRAQYDNGGNVLPPGVEPEDDAVPVNTAPQQGLASAQPQTLGQKASGLASTVGENLKKPEVFIPLLTGIAAWAGAPTQHPLVALAQGLGAAGSAYQGQREFGLEQQRLGQTQQQIGIEQQLANYRGLETGYRGQQIQNETMARLLPVFENNYSLMPGRTDATGNPLYYDKSSGQPIPASEYARRRSNFLISIANNGTSSGVPAAVTSMLGGSNAPSPTVNLPPGSADGAGGGLGAGPAIGAVASGSSTSAGGNQPVVPARRSAQTQLAPTATVAQKLKAGAYLGKPQTLPDIDYGSLTDSTNPNLLTQQGMQLVQNGISPEQVATGRQMLEMANDIRSGKTPAQTKNGQLYYGFQNAANAQATNQQVQASYAQQVAQRNKDAGAFTTEQYPAMRQVLNSLERINSETNTNRLSSDFSNLIGAASSIPGLSDIIAPSLKQYQDATEEAQKDTAILSINRAVQAHIASHAPAAALHTTGQTVPGPDRGPGARYDLIAQQEAQLARTNDFYNQWNANKGQVQDVSSYDADWAAEHPIEAYEKQAYDRIAPFPGMTQKEMLAHPRHPNSINDLSSLRPGVPFVIPAGPLKGKIGFTQ